jgi:hypothetical protein
MVYEYKCTNSDECGAVTEHTQRMSDPQPDSIVCKYCNSIALIKLSAPAIMTGGLKNQSFDAAIGRDSEKRWKTIHEQQEARNKVRRETGSAGLQGVRPNEFRPISEEQKQVRTKVSNAVERDGYRTETPGMG